MSFVSAIDRKIQALQEINKKADEIAADVLKENEDVILDLNTEDQLFEKGITADGQKIADKDPYTPFTVRIKRQKGQPTERVTLRDSGDFHGSFRATKSGSDRVIIDATDPKTADLVERYGEEIFGLSPENMGEMSENYIKPEVTQLIEKAFKS